MNDLNLLLTSSIQHYEELIVMFEAINHDKGSCNPATLQARCTELLQMQSEIALADEALTVAMQATSGDPSALSFQYPLIEKWQALMHQAFIHNRSLLATIQNLQSLLAHEIKEMQGGRAALHGYRQTTASQQGSILNASR
ncbi:MAG: hypothetical protein J0665_11965 [Deltaproteobacteria bacterium]|nr:hypothetical protein [Deltaproteobacteria bacterium]